MGVLGGQGTGLGAQQAPHAQVGGAVALCFSPTPPQGSLPPASPDLPGLPPMPPRTHAAWRGLGGWGISLGAQQAPRARVDRAIALCSSPALPGECLPPASPDIPGLMGADLVWPPLLLPLGPPTSYRFTLGFLPSSWGSEFPTSSRQAP